jgi:probable HAF family extracellular repeat protein
MMQLKLRVRSSASLSCRGLGATLFVFLIAFAGLARESRAQGPWEAIDIGTMFEGWDTVANAVNNRGQVVGLAQAPLSDGTLHRRAFIWTPATGFVDLGHLGREESTALGINNAGQVVGESRTQNYAYRAFLWSPATGMVDIDGTGSVSRARDINDAGVVTGSRQVSGSYRAFRWTTGGGMVDLRGPVSFGSAINDAGMIGGSGGPVNTGQPLPRHPFVWSSDGGLQNLPLLTPSLNAQVDVEGVSNAGQVVGYNAEDPLHPSAFSWTAASGMLGIATWPSAVNDKGLIVGGGGATRVGGPLLDLGNPAGLTDYTPRDVNGSGVVVGSAYFRNSNPDRYVQHAVVWRPRSDVAVNFGTGSGVWLLGKSGWSQVHGFGPESVTAADVDGNGLDDVVMDFGATYGVWLWLNHTTWMPLHGLSPTEVAVGDLDGNGQDELVLNFPGHGVWIWRNNSSWQFLHALNAQRLAVGNLDGVNGEDVIADFPGAGLWVFMNNGTWVPLHGQSAMRLVTGDLDGNGKDEVVIDLPVGGLWIYWNNATWQQLDQLHSAHIAIGDPKGAAKASLVIDFGSGSGIWQWHHPTGWTSLHRGASAGILLADRDANGKDEILINFGASGLWQYSDTGAWSLIHGARPAGMATGVLH